MPEVNVTELRQNLPAWLERARRGEHIRVTARGQIIAEISAPKVTGYEAEAIRARLRGSVLHYDSPTEPAHGPQEWSTSR